MDVEVQDTNTKDALAAPELYITGNDPDVDSLCSSSQGSTPSFHNSSPASSADSFKLCEASASLVSHYNELIGEILQDDGESVASKDRPRPCSGKVDTQRGVIKKDRLEKKERYVSFEINIEKKSALTTSNNKFESVDSNRQDYESVLSNLSELVRQPSERFPTQSSDIHSLISFTEEDIGIAADCVPEHVIGLKEKSQKSSEQMKSIPRQSVNRALKPVLVSKLKHEHLP